MQAAFVPSMPGWEAPDRDALVALLTAILFSWKLPWLRSLWCTSSQWQQAATSKAVQLSRPSTLLIRYVMMLYKAVI